MKVERILRITATVKAMVSEREYEQAEEGALRAIAIQRFRSYLWVHDRALVDEIIEKPGTSYTVLHLEYNRDEQRLLGTIVAEVPLTRGEPT